MEPPMERNTVAEKLHYINGVITESGITLEDGTNDQMKKKSHCSQPGQQINPYWCNTIQQQEMCAMYKALYCRKSDRMSHCTDKRRAE